MTGKPQNAPRLNFILVIGGILMLGVSIFIPFLGNVIKWVIGIVGFFLSGSGIVRAFQSNPIQFILNILKWLAQNVQPLTEWFYALLLSIESHLPRRKQFYILYHVDNVVHVNQDINRNKSILIQSVLETAYRRCSAPSNSWEHPNKFADFLGGASKTIHSVLIVTNSLLANVPPGDRDSIEQQVLQIAIKREVLDKKENESQGTLIFLEADLLQQFQRMAEDQAKQLSAFLLSSKEELAREQILEMIPHNHCQLKFPPSAQQELQPPQQNLTGEIESGSLSSEEIGKKPGLLRLNTAKDKNRLFIPRNKRRNSNLDNLYKQLDEHHCQVLYGPVGSGKTQIALAFAHENYQGSDNSQPTKRYSSIFWLNAATLETEIETKLRQTMNLKKVRGKTWLECFLEKLKTYKEGLEEGKRWLLVIDGCDREKLRLIYEHFNDDRDISGFFSLNKYQGHIICTMAGNAHPPSSVHVDQLRRIDYMQNEEIEDAALLLVRIIFRDAGLKKWEDVEQLLRGLKHNNGRFVFPRLSAREAYWEGAKNLVQKLDGNPLLIEYVGMYIHAQGRKPQDYLEMYEETLRVIDRKQDNQNHVVAHQGQARAQDAADYGWDRFIEQLWAVWEIHFKEIESNINSKLILMLCVFLGSESIPRKIIDRMPRKGSKEPLYPKTGQSDPDLGRLKNSEFIGYEEQPFDLIHLRSFARDAIRRLQDPAEEIGNQFYAIHALSTAFQQEKATILSDSREYEFYRPHIDQCIEYLKDGKMIEHLRMQPVEIQTTIFEFLCTIGDYRQQWPAREYNTNTTDLTVKYLFEVAMQIYAWLPLATSKQAAFAQHIYRIAKFYHDGQEDRSRLKDAEKYYLEALTCVNDATVSTAVDASHDLGRLYGFWNKHELAEEYFRRAMNKLDAYLFAAPDKNAGSLRKAEILLSRAANYTAQGKCCQLQDQRQAHQHYDEAHSVYQEVLSILIKDAMGKLNGSLSKDTGPLRRAELLLRNATDWVVQGKNTQKQVQQYPDKAHQDQKKQARQYYEKAHMAYQEALGLLKDFKNIPVFSEDRKWLIQRRYQFGLLALRLCEFERIGTATLERELASIVFPAPQDLNTMAPLNPLGGFQIVLDFCNVAEGYRRLAQQSLHKKRYFNKSKEYLYRAMDTLTSYDESFIQRYQLCKDVSSIIWRSVRYNPRFKHIESSPRQFQEKFRLGEDLSEIV